MISYEITDMPWTEYKVVGKLTKSPFFAFLKKEWVENVEVLEIVYSMPHSKRKVSSWYAARKTL